MAENFEFRNHIVNMHNSSRIIHLGIGTRRRFDDIKEKFPNIPDSINSYTLFCEAHHSQLNKLCYGNKYTENPYLATCSICKKNAEKWGYKASNVDCVSSIESISPSKFSIDNITKWIPSDCEIVIKSNDIIVVDKLTKEDIKVETVKRAVILIIEKCFVPFTPNDILNDKSLLSKEVFNVKGRKLSVQGLKFDNKSKQFDGITLKAGNDLINHTFEYLFSKGLRFSDGSPFGKLKKDRKPFVKHDVENSLGISVPDEFPNIAETLIGE